LTFGIATSHGPRISFLYFCAQIKTAGARKMTKMRVVEMRYAIVHESDAVRITAERKSDKVNEACTTMAEVCKRWRKAGNNAKACTEKRIRANTPTSVVKRDAKTTDADIAAFFDNTDVKRSGTCIAL